MRLALAAAALALGSCGSKKDTCSDFPSSVGYQPLEPVQATDGWPPTRGGSPATPSWARRKTTVPYSPARVYQALQSPAASALILPDPTRGDRWASSPGTEPFPITFTVHYAVFDTITVEWDLAYRGGVSQGTPTAPTEIGFRYQKTCGTEYISVQSGSLVARATADPNVTELEMVGWLVGYGQGPDTVAGTLTDWLASLQVALAALGPAP